MGDNLYKLEGAVNNIKTSVMPPLHYVALSRPCFKHTLGCSNLRDSSLTSGDLRCSFAPAHLYQMISSSISNPPFSKHLHPSHLMFPHLLPFLLSYPSTFLLSLFSVFLHSVSVSPQVCVGEFWDEGADRDRSRAIQLKAACMCMFNMTSIQIKKD